VLFRSLRFNLAKRSNRQLATLVANEEFPYSVTVTPKTYGPSVVTESTLPNGVKIISKDNGAAAVSLKFTILSGNKGVPGAGHLASVCAFNGTVVSGLALVRGLESIGAEFSSCADREKVTYEVKVLPDYAKLAFEIVTAPILLPSKRDYVIEESKHTAQIIYDEYKSSPSTQLKELIHEAAFGEGSPMGLPFYLANPEKISAESLISFRDSNRIGGNIIVSGSGISHESLKALVETWFGDLPSGAFAASSSYVGGEAKSKTETDGISYLGLAFPLPNDTAGQILCKLLSSNVESLDVPSGSLTSFNYSGLFGFYATGTPDAVAGYLGKAVAELKAIASSTPDIKAITTKISLENYLALEGDSSSFSANPDVRNVSASSVSAAASAVLKATPAYAALGSGTPTYASITKMLS